MDAERQVSLIRYAIVQAFQKPTTTKANVIEDDDDEIIDTTQPGFTEKFTIVNAT